MSDETSFSEMFTRLVADQLAEVMAHRERYVKAWLAETGLLPSESELIEQLHQDGTVAVRIQRRSA